MKSCKYENTRCLGNGPGSGYDRGLFKGHILHKISYLQAKSTMKKKLYTQTSILSETPVGTPENVQPIISQHLGPPMKKAKTRTKIIKKGSLLIAKQPSPAQASKENVYPRTATQVSKVPLKPNYFKKQ